jgi:hypothetical protein
MPLPMMGPYSRRLRGPSQPVSSSSSDDGNETAPIITVFSEGG